MRLVVCNSWKTVFWEEVLLWSGIRWMQESVWNSARKWRCLENWFALAWFRKMNIFGQRIGLWVHITFWSQNISSPVQEKELLSKEGLIMADQTLPLNVSDEMKSDDERQNCVGMENDEELCSSSATDKLWDRVPAG